jgi:aromatic amino acid aminotransferase I
MMFLGDPHFSLYPIRRMEFEIPTLDSEDPVHSWRFASGSTQRISASTDASSSVVPLPRVLGYTTGAGLPETQKILAQFTQLFHSAPNHQVTPTLGNCDGVSKAFRLFGDRGDSFLADEFSFSALTNAAVAHGVNWVPVEIDEGGLVPAELERILANWKEETQGRRPHVLYTTP